MVPQARSSHIRRFGTFEVDLRAGELRKQGKRIRLQEQPFHVLTVLLQRPGDVVSREELRSQIWPEGTFVDFDNSLNTAVNKLREALADSAENRVFIENPARDVVTAFSFPSLVIIEKSQPALLRQQDQGGGLSWPHR